MSSSWTGALAPTCSPTSSLTRAFSLHTSQCQSPSGTSTSCGRAQYVWRARLQPSQMSSFSSSVPLAQHSHTASSAASSSCSTSAAASACLRLPLRGDDPTSGSPPSPEGAGADEPVSALEAAALPGALGVLKALAAASGCVLSSSGTVVSASALSSPPAGSALAALPEGTGEGKGCTIPPDERRARASKRSLRALASASALSFCCASSITRRNSFSRFAARYASPESGPCLRPLPRPEPGAARPSEPGARPVPRPRPRDVGAAKLLGVT
eukprot:545030-Prymnesium_polylepis.1